MENWIAEGKSVTILTVYSGTRSRGVDAESYARKIGASWLGLGLVEAGVSRGGEPQPLPSDILRQNLLKYECCIGPIGVSHPEHFLVRRALPPQSLLYLDVPYSVAQKNSTKCSKALYGSVVISFCKPSVRKWRHIPLFRDQSKFFYFNPPERLRESFELIVK